MAAADNVPPLLAADVNAAEHSRLQRLLATQTVTLERLMATTAGYVNRMNTARAALLATGVSLGYSPYELNRVVEQVYRETLGG